MSRYLLPLALIAVPLSAQDDPASSVSADRLRSDVEAMVGFGTRHTLSEQDHPTRGIGAAIRWGHETDVLTATEDEIVEAMKLHWKRMKIVIEASCSVPLAVILKNPDRFRGKRVGVILTGGNVDLDKLPWMKG